jgi:hypothetical protein
MLEGKDPSTFNSSHVHMYSSCAIPISDDEYIVVPFSE